MGATLLSSCIRLATPAEETAFIDRHANYDPADFEQWLDDLRGQVWNDFIKGRRSLDELAALAHLHPNTVEKFAWNETRDPKAKTFFGIARAIGFRMPMIPQSAPQQPDERDLQPQTRRYRHEVSNTNRPNKDT